MSIPAHTDSRSNGLQSGAKVGVMSGRAHPRWYAKMCTRAEGRRRKAHPVFCSIMECIFRQQAQPESMSRNFTSFRVAFSQAPLKRKAHPAQDCNSGMRFPRVHIKEKDPFAEVLVNSRWRGRESRPRAARTDRCGACAPCELRWQTLSRFLSSAPSRGSIPCGDYIKEKDPFAEVLVNSRWRGRESNP